MATSPKPRQLPLLAKILILRRILLLNDGRDKVLKIIQYTAKTLLWAYLIDQKTNPVAIPRTKALASHFSTARKIIRLLHWLEPFNSLNDFFVKEDGARVLLGTSKEQLTPLARQMLALEVFNNTVGIVNDVSDDVICLGKLSVVDKRWVSILSPLSDRLWYTSIFLDMNQNLYDTRKLEIKLKKAEKEGDAKTVSTLREKLYMQRISLAKLCADWVFCTYDVFGLGDKGWSEGWQNVSGLIAALLGTYKLWVKHQ
ncbi:hypothetical protein HK102_013984 [Quaeritorhiza haematococci]|nr:hypothetical protein HK102_013984 [Quaeritorhiza haematococci]